jgi:hypothetical protein
MKMLYKRLTHLSRYGVLYLFVNYISSLFYSSTVQKDAENETSIWTSIVAENSSEVAAQAKAQATANSTYLDDEVSMFNYPLTTVSSTIWDENK